MGVRFDRFTWIAIGVVIVLVVAAIATVTLTDGRGWQGSSTFVDPQAPAAPVVNAFVALENGELYTARDQYSEDVLSEISREDFDPFTGRGGDRGARRLRILEQEIDPENSDRALVTFVQDGYSRSGLFGSGNTWSRRAVVEVVREDGQWKINSQEFFY